MDSAAAEAILNYAGINVMENLKHEIDPKLPKGYEIKYFVGEGSSGAVYAAVNENSHVGIAVKVVHSIIDVSKRRRIAQESEIQRKLSHVNIAKIHGSIFTFSYAVIVMELVTSGDLFDLIPVGEGLNIQKGFKIYNQLLSAVEYMHSMGIVHMDIKPENIMISCSGRPKLIDFGLAVDHNQQPTIKGHRGTLAYSAPETFSDHEYTGYKADLFSLHITFLTMVTGERCWCKATLEDFHYLDWHERRWTMDVFKRIPTDLLSFLMSAMAYDPAERFSVLHIKQHIWYRNGLANKIKAVRLNLNYPLPISQPMLPRENANISFEKINLDRNLIFSQPVDFGRLLMPEFKDKKNALSIVRRMTRFFSNANLVDTVHIMETIIAQHHHCTILPSDNHLMVETNVSGFFVTFQIFIYHFANSVLVDFRRVRGDGLLFHNTFSEIMVSVRQLGLANDKHPYLGQVRPIDSK